MADAVLTTMSIEDFLRWDETQDDRHEFVNGVPVAMGGASQGHNQIVANVSAELRNRLKGKPCRSGTPDSMIKAPNGNIRMPDAMVFCGPYDRTKMIVEAPVLVFEVLSKSTAFMDMFLKLEDYKSVPSITGIVYLDQDRITATIVRRIAPSAWATTIVDNAEAVLSFPDLELDLPMAEIYDRVFEGE